MGSITLDLPKLNQGIAQAKAGLDVAAGFVRKMMGEAMYEIARDILVTSQNRLAPQNRSERLSQSAVFETPRFENGDILLRLGFQAPHAAIRDQGGVIVPTKADTLAIPQAPILDANGESRYANPRQEPKLFVIRIPAKNFAGLAMKVGDKLEIHWVFKDRVVQSGSHYFTGTIEERRAQIAPLAAQLLKSALDGRAA